MASSSVSFELGDPVHVSRETGPQLEGVVAYIGPVDFSSSEMVGIRLTGSSIGGGKHSGTVQNKPYFECPPNCGIFVLTQNVSKRALTKLEELKLRRELKTTTTTMTTTAPTSPIPRSPPRVASSSRSSTTTTTTTPPHSTATTKTPEPATATTTQKPVNKLEELRQRRAALNARKEAAVVPDATATAISSSAPAVTATTTTTTTTTTAAAAAAAAATSTTTAASAVPMTTTTSSSAMTPPPSVTSSQPDERITIQQLQKELQSTRQQLHDKQDELEQVRAAAAAAQSTKQHSSSNNDPDVVGVEHLKQQLKQNYHDQLTALRQQMEQQVQQLQRDHAEQIAAAALLQQQQQQPATVRHDTSYYKERAQWQAELSVQKRRIELLEKEKVDLEATMENMTLDKEQLEQEKEALEDAVEEMKLDAETARLEMDELRMELDDARAAMTSGSIGGAGLHEKATTGGENEDVTQMLSVQNARLRDALIRFREQAAIEKSELARKLRDTEKDAEAGRSLSAELESLRRLKVKLEEEISDLKDMVEQGSAFEDMVEHLTDRVMTMEEGNSALRGTIRELEEASELTAEMEEVQADEIKDLTRDLENRDTVVRNLEEAIKMQRRREDDLVHTVANYRTTVATLKQEKHALLELQRGGEGEKSNLVAASQNALARAAQLVSDAADVRRREAVAAVERIEGRTFKHLANRLETLLPQVVTSTEVGAIKGELSAAKTVGTASTILEGIHASFVRAIRPSLGSVEESSPTESLSLKLSDETRQKVVTMLYQTQFANAVVSVASDLIRFLAATQWPDLLTREGSLELASILGHSTLSLDDALNVVLRSLKEEGLLTPEQSNLGALQQTITAALLSLRSDIERDDDTLLSGNWNPPGWELIRDVTVAKFCCQGAAAAISSVLDDTEDRTAPPALINLYNQVERASAQSHAICGWLANLDVTNRSLVDELSNLVGGYKVHATNLLSSVDGTLSANGDINTCYSYAQGVLGVLPKLSAALRSANMNQSDEEAVHTLSPENQDAWARVARLCRALRSIDGDPEDVHYLQRARAIETRLTAAVENEPKLERANEMVAVLEKNLASKSKEVSMLTARLSELEKLLAKSSTGNFGRGKAVETKSSEEVGRLQEEIRVLTEAVDVLHRQVDDYENEIRALKDFKSPARSGQRNRTPRRTLTSVGEQSPYARVEDQTSSGALEANIFRPALQRALKDASKWRASAVASALADLPPLPVVTDEISEASDKLLELTSALANFRLERASVRLVDLTQGDKSARVQLRESAARVAAASERIHSIVRRSKGLQ